MSTRGDYDDAVEYFSEIANYEFVKLCLSSRPWPVFREKLQDQPQLRLQDLTFEDIKHYVQDKLKSNSRMLSLERREPRNATQLIQRLVDKASGVFFGFRLL